MVFKNPNSGISIEKISELITLIHDVIRDLLPGIPFQGKKRFRCPRCGHDLTQLPQKGISNKIFTQ